MTQPSPGALLGLLLSLSLPAAAGDPPLLDLDGDGTRDPISVGASKTTIGAATAPCGTDEACEVELHDVSNADRFREVALCTRGVRDERECRLYRYDGGALTEFSFTRTVPGQKKAVDWPPSAVLTRGSGIVLGDFASRWYTRREKWVARGTTLEHFPQPAYRAGILVPVDRTFPIVDAPGGERVVANVAPGTSITAVLESGEHADWFLVEISSGLMGWCTLEQLIAASDQMMMIAGAG